MITFLCPYQNCEPLPSNVVVRDGSFIDLIAYQIGVSAINRDENEARKKNLEEVNSWIQLENDKRRKEAEALQARLEKEKQELRAYIEKDNKAMKAKLSEEEEVSCRPPPAIIGQDKMTLQTVFDRYARDRRRK